MVQDVQDKQTDTAKSKIWVRDKVGIKENEDLLCSIKRGAGKVRLLKKDQIVWYCPAEKENYQEKRKRKTKNVMD